MKFTMPQKALADAIKTVLPAVSTKNMIPVLSGIHIEVLGPGSIQFTASDAEVSLQLTSTGEVAQKGALVIEAKRLAALVEKIDGPVTIEANPANGHAWIRWGKSKAELNAWPSDQFINVPVPDTELLTVRADRLAKLLDQTLFAVSDDASKPWLTGPLLQIRNGQVLACGAETVAFAIWKGDLEAAGDTALREVIPRKAGQLLSRFLPDKDIRISLGIGQRQLIFQLPNLTLTCRTMDGQYPDLERLVPSVYPITVRIQRQELIQVLERAAPFGSDRGVRWDIRSGELRVTAKSDAGNIDEPLPCECEGTNETAVGFNVGLVLAGLKVFTGDVVHLEMIDHKNPTRFRSPSDPEFTYTVLPLLGLV